MAEGMEVRVLNKEVVLAARPRGLPKEADFKVIESELVFMQPPPPGSGEVVLQLLWVSVDPYLRQLMKADNAPQGLAVFDIGKDSSVLQPLKAHSLSKVVASDNPFFKEGDIAYGTTTVANYAVILDAAKGFRKINLSRPNIPLTHYLGVLGMPGHSSWVGINIITQLKPKDEVFISAASGAVGLLVGQLAKLKGCRVVGSTGSYKKVNILKEAYHFDDAFNYKQEESFELALRRYFPNGFDVYFDNVGGQMFKAALEVISPHGRIVVCGMVSQYNKKVEEVEDRDGVNNLFNIVGKSLKIEGFLSFNFLESWDAFEEEVISLLKNDKIRYESDIMGRGIEEFSKALIGMLTGENVGKAIVFVSNEG